MYIAAGNAMKKLALGLDAIYPYISGTKAVDGAKLKLVLGAVVDGFSMSDDDADAVENGIDAVKGAGQEIMNIKMVKIIFGTGWLKKKFPHGKILLHTVKLKRFLQWLVLLLVR